MVVGFNDHTGITEVLGSGFLVGSVPHLLALTATHVITEWADKVRPPATNTFAALLGESDLDKRVQQLINANLIRAVVHCGPEGHRLCKIGSISFTANPRTVDVACLRLIRPSTVKPQNIGAIRIDADEYLWDEPVLIAGFVQGSQWTPPEIEDGPLNLTQNMCVRVGFCRGLIEKPQGMKYPMFQLNMPSLPGMSGGPVFAFRYPNGRPRLISTFPSTHLTAIGIISRDYMTQPCLLDGSDPGETLATPIEDAYLMNLALSSTDKAYLGDVVKRGVILSYGTRARTAEVKSTGSPGEIAIRFSERAPGRWIS
jgi:hypothetical protein